MQIITRKKSNSFALFLLISGLGALWLTFWWYSTTLGNNSIGGRSHFSSFPVLYYYVFNSALLILMGIVLRLRNFKIYSILAIILGISVSISLFIFGNGNVRITNNFFIYTTYLGMTAGTMYGGIILVPMFLSGVYISTIRGIQHIRGKINYVDLDMIPQDQMDASGSSNISTQILNTKSITQETIPVIGIITGLVDGISSWRFLFLPELQGQRILMVLVPISLMALSVFSLLNKNVKVYRIINVIIAVIILFPLLLVGINVFFSLYLVSFVLTV